MVWYDGRKIHAVYFRRELSHTVILIGLEFFYEVSEQTKPIGVKPTRQTVCPWQLSIHICAMLFTGFQSQRANS